MADPAGNPKRGGPPAARPASPGTPGAPGEDRTFWRQVGAVTESDIAPPKDGWKKISARIDAETAAQVAQSAPPPQPSGEAGIRLPGFLVWLVGGLLLTGMFLIAHRAQPDPLPPPPIEKLPPPPPPVETGTRRMRIEWLKPPLTLSRKAKTVTFSFRITNVGSGKIVLPGPATGSRHYFLTVRHDDRQWQYPLVATAADRVLAAGGARALSDLSTDVPLEPYEALVVQIDTDADTLMSDGEVGQYQLTIRYAPPASSERTSPPETDSSAIQVTVVK